MLGDRNELVDYGEKEFMLQALSVEVGLESDQRVNFGAQGREGSS